MSARETGGHWRRRIGGWGDKEVLQGSTVTARAPLSSKLHSRQAVSDYPHVEARIRLDRRNFAISLFSRARIGKFKISVHDGRVPDRRAGLSILSPSDDTKSELFHVEAIPRPFLEEPIEFHHASRHGTDSLATRGLRRGGVIDRRRTMTVREVGLIRKSRIQMSASLSFLF